MGGGGEESQSQYLNIPCISEYLVLVFISIKQFYEGSLCRRDIMHIVNYMNAALYKIL